MAANRGALCAADVHDRRKAREVVGIDDSPCNEGSARAHGIVEYARLIWMAFAIGPGIHHVYMIKRCLARCDAVIEVTPSAIQPGAEDHPCAKRAFSVRTQLFGQRIQGKTTVARLSEYPNAHERAQESKERRCMGSRRYRERSS